MLGPIDGTGNFVAARFAHERRSMPQVSENYLSLYLDWCWFGRVWGGSVRANHVEANDLEFPHSVLVAKLGEMANGNGHPFTSCPGS
jgi:hypothetical protein